MPLAPGQTLSFYEILGPLGAGAMGEVYRAKDTRLDREVAIKVLPEHFAEDEERLRRFEREAKSLASLNHPNVAQIHGVDQVGDTWFLVLELVPGETLEERIARGALPVEETVDVCRQIAEGLEAAHESGVIHRDLKPANVRVTPEGKVKVLDFGLAKPTGPDAEAGPAADSVLATEEGRLLGTPTYMAPEQARGKPIDRRVDVWAFGCVLYECLTGQRAFDGETMSDVIASLLDREPDWSALSSRTPIRVRELLRRTLEKDPRRRLRDIGDARIELEDALAAPMGSVATGVVAPRPGAKSLGLLAAGAIALFLLGVGSTRFWVTSDPPILRAPVRFEFDLPEGIELPRGEGPNIAVAPDGSAIVYAGRDASGSQLFIRHLDELRSRPIPGTRDALVPFFSPDSAWVGFEHDGGLKRVSLSGDELYTICDNCGGGTWGEDGRIIFTREGSSLWRIPAVGGEPELVADPSTELGISSIGGVVVLPGSETVVFEIGSLGFGGIGALSLTTGKVVRLAKEGSSPMYTSSGHVLFPRGDTLIALPFDADLLAPTGPAVPVLRGVRVENGGAVQANVSRNGLLAYAPASSQIGTRLTWVDKTGATSPVIPQWRIFSAPRLSPNGEEIAVVMFEGSRSDVWIVDASSGGMRPLTTSGDALAPEWTPDGTRIAFATGGVGDCAIRWTRADGNGPLETLIKSESTLRPQAWHPGGDELVIGESSVDGTVFVLNVRDGSRREVLASEFSTRSLTLSPDGRFLAYESGKAGFSAVYVRPYSGPGPELAVTPDGGSEPVWGTHGLYYRTPNAEFFVVTLELEPRPRVLRRERLFLGGAFWNAGQRTHFDVHPDGERLLVLSEAELDASSSRLRVVEHWIDELERRASADE